MDIEVSIIIPAYNAEQYITRCLDSIVKQVGNNVEVIIVNDGSTDNTRIVCEKYVDKYNYISLLNQRNSGVSVARNNGLDKARGRIVMFIDSDDCLPDDVIEWAIRYQECDTLVCGSFNYLKTRNRIHPCILEDGIYELCSEDIDFFLNLVPNAPWGKLYLKKIIDENNIRFPVGIPYGEDTIFLIEYLKNISRIQLSSKIVYNYNFTDAGSAMWKYYPDYYKYMLEIMDRKKKYCIAKSYVYQREKDCQLFFKRSLNHYLKNGHREYVGELMEAFRINGNEKVLVRKWYMDNLVDYYVYKVKKILMHKS